MDPEEAENLAKSHAQDTIDEEEYKKFLEGTETGGFGKLMVYNDPIYLLYIALFFSMVNGAS